MKKNFLSALTLTLVLGLASYSNAGGGHKGKELSGAGATFPLTFYNIVFEEFAHTTGSVVAYGGIGSGGGVRNLRDGIVDFACSDAFLTDREMQAMDSVVHIPTCMGAVVVAYNLDGVDSLNLTGELVADIFAGEVTMWNDARIAALNPGAMLPAEPVIPVYRSDGSGTTFVFTDYLAKVSPVWAARYGAGKSVNFPTGQAAKGNPGVAGIIAGTRNAIGYVGSEYAFAQKIPCARIGNVRGEFVAASPTSISAAASGRIPADTRVSITNADASGAYPIATFTWMIVYKEQRYADRSKEQAVATLDMLRYILSDEAQGIASEVHYAPLPAGARELGMKNLGRVTYGGETILN